MTSVEGVSLQGVSEMPAAVSAAPIDTPPIEVKNPLAGLTPSDCGCGCGGAAKAESKPAASADCGCGRQAAPQLAYAFGSLDVDFGTEARRDVFVQAMHQQMSPRANPADPEQLAEFLDKSPEYEQGLTWIIRLDAAPVYAVRPVGTYAQSTAEKLRTLFRAFANTKKGEEEIQLASFPGYVHGRARLISGLEVPVIYPDSRGIFGWKVNDLAKSVGKDAEASAAVENFLNRIYFEFRNLGLMPKDRALNYAATNAFQVGGVFSKALADKMVLDTISVQ